jgi:hypothetical protein
MVDGPKNTAASVRQRLQNVLRLTKRGFWVKTESAYSSASVRALGFNTNLI